MVYCLLYDTKPLNISALETASELLRTIVDARTDTFKYKIVLNKANIRITSQLPYQKGTCHKFYHVRVSSQTIVAKEKLHKTFSGCKIRPEGQMNLCYLIASQIPKEDIKE